MFDIKLIVGTRDKYSLPICPQKVTFCGWRTQKKVWVMKIGSLLEVEAIGLAYVIRSLLLVEAMGLA